MKADMGVSNSWHDLAHLGPANFVTNYGLVHQLVKLLRKDEIH